MKSILAAKMSAMRKRSALASSAASSTGDGAAGTTRDAPKEPSVHHGKMRMLVDDHHDPTILYGDFDAEEVVDIVLCISIDMVHVVVDGGDSTIVFDSPFAAMKEITWDHTECSLRFVLEDGTNSAVFIFASSLMEVEAQLTAAIRHADLRRPPDQVYVGVLVGRNLPSSPIHQRRASIASGSNAATASVPASKRRDLLAHERPPRHILAREKLAITYFKTGVLQFPCSINGDARGLKLDGNYLYVFPSPESFERSACLFSYLYEQIDTCDVRNGTRLELRFHRSDTKQPTFIACHAPEALYVRDAIWFFKHGVSMDVYFQRCLMGNNSSQRLRDRAPSLASSSPVAPSPRRRSSLASFRDEGALLDRMNSRCRVIGCARRFVTETDDADINFNGGGGTVKHRGVWFCGEHTDATGSGSPPRSPSKRSGLLLSRAKSSAVMAPLIHTKHYVQSIKYHGTLLKSGGKYQMTKAWNVKIIALLDTPVGGFLCYYDKLAHCPGMSEMAPKERRVIDLASVICIRRESTASNRGAAHATVPFAFDIVTVYRTWTFGTSDLQEYEVWLHVLSDAIQKHSATAPDRPMRYPVRCLRDPLENLPSRSDGNTSLEISSNGVTVCSGTDGECEVYNWYFTEIQKWSVAKQHDTACCFLSCLYRNGTPTSPSSSSTAPTAAAAVYHDFLFQTNEAEAICATIEFFVGKCMAKLEVLSLVYAESLTRPAPPSRRPSFEPSTVSTAKQALVATLTKKESLAAESKQFMLGAVPLRPVGVLQLGPVVETPMEGSSIIPLVERVSVSPSAKTFADDAAPVEARPPSPPCISPSSSPVSIEEIAIVLPAEQAMISMADTSDTPPPKKMASSSFHYPFDGETTCEPISADDQETASVSASDEVVVKRDPHTNNGSSRQVESAPMVPQNVSTVDETRLKHLVSESNVPTETIAMDEAWRPSAAELLPSLRGDFSAASVWPDGLERCQDDAVAEMDSDRFESFEYNECAVVVVDGDETKEAEEVDEEEDDEEDFEDALDEAAQSIAVLEEEAFSSYDDEESVVVLEEDTASESDPLDFGDTEDLEDSLLNPVDEVFVSPPHEGSAAETKELLPVVCSNHTRKALIPEYSKRRWAQVEYEAGLEYDDTLERVVVYSVRFHRGKLQHK